MTQIYQLRMCDACAATMQKTAAGISQNGMWSVLYCPHEKTLAYYMTEFRAVARMQLNGPIDENLAQHHIDSVRAAGEFKL